MRLRTLLRTSVLQLTLVYVALFGASELAQIRQLFTRASIYGLTLMMALALVGGVLMALSARRRLAELNRTTRQIMAGDLGRRAPIRGSGDEHDELAANINAMLDQIQN